MRRILPILTPRNAGFSLIEIAIVLIVLGIIGGMSLQLFTAHLQRAALLRTREHQEYAITALAAFVETHHRFPCPADPKATGMDAGIEPKERRCPGIKAEGILPFRTLGISESFAKDGFKHWMTYVVDPILANKENQGYLETVEGKQIIVQNDAGHSVLMDPKNFIAVLLISHGESGGGAFTTAGRLLGPAPSPAKRENQDSNFVFVTSPTTDDILRWETRDHFLKHYGR